MAAFLRPILSASMPDGTAPTIAPMANSEAIHVNWAVVARISPSDCVGFFGTSRSFTGDVHDRPVPAAAALRHTARKQREEKQNHKNKRPKLDDKQHIMM